MEKIEFQSVKEMINWLIDNEGSVLFDDYGRRWLYKNYKFRFGNINEPFEMKLDCLHLFKTNLYH